MSHDYPSYDVEPEPTDKLQVFSFDLRLDAGFTARAHLAFRTYGTLDAHGRNAVLLCGYYTGTTKSYDRWIAPGGPFATDGALTTDGTDAPEDTSASTTERASEHASGEAPEGASVTDETPAADGLFIVTCGLFGNGESWVDPPAENAHRTPGDTAPETQPLELEPEPQLSGSTSKQPPEAQPPTSLPHPATSIADNVRAQKTLLEHLGVQHLLMVAGWSMGGMQTLEWARRYPAFCSTALAECATATCHPINQAFLMSIRSILARPDGLVDESLRARDAFGRAYMPWALSARFFAAGEYRQFGYTSLQDEFDAWGRDHQTIASRDLLSMLDTWLTWQGPSQLEGAAQPEPERPEPERPGQKPSQPEPENSGVPHPHVVLMPSTTDRYFLLEDAQEDARLMGADLVPIASTLGHVAGRPGIRATETAQIGHVVHYLLEEAQA